jgi:hypothetical protein
MFLQELPTGKSLSHLASGYGAATNAIQEEMVCSMTKKKALF